jgi:hypothetical protein
MYAINALAEIVVAESYTLARRMPRPILLPFLKYLPSLQSPELDSICGTYLTQKFSFDTVRVYFVVGQLNAFYKALVAFFT